MEKPAYPIKTGRLRLRPYGPGDFDDFFAMHSREDVVRYLYWDIRDREQVATMLERRQARTAIEREGDGLILAIEMPETGRVIGDVLLQWTSATHRQGEIGFVLHPDFQGRGDAPAWLRRA